MFDFIHFSSLTQTGCCEYRTQNYQFYSSILMTRMLISYISKLCLETVIHYFVLTGVRGIAYGHCILMAVLQG